MTAVKKRSGRVLHVISYFMRFDLSNSTIFSYTRKYLMIFISHDSRIDGFAKEDFRTTKRWISCLTTSNSQPIQIMPCSTNR